MQESRQRINFCVSKISLIQSCDSLWLVKGACDWWVSVCFKIFNMEIYVSNSLLQQKHIWKHASIQNPVSLVVPNWGIGNPAQFKVFPEYCGRINRQEKTLKCRENYPVSGRDWEWTVIHDDVYQFILWVTVKTGQRLLMWNGRNFRRGRK